ncbi:hypothetical protein AtNW77_Chr2g0256391 [Arabidopsis thaliana]|uniref:Cystic fibrosis transmembrane conductance regulator n=5 Tax=Arabidopsis TaxID=3701 RepID=A0A178VY03_ARATH|nr:cystic fibrosis transmembrane conductance regulator [Arabidopsis thaliana]KAG7638592.1 hypothetical protein ISN45_At02g030180 [Arabidopsis thaliana x Arabidopsis arenosa]KAG7643204.1 hypothetical protein ISN44_As02g030430 [Arabidopsis suecica]AAM15039.1 Expressed protein [Arabidopsis thaliana]AAM65888.1 unknown [Arabidopsis thaliana]ABD60707.1 At2g35585 [Arabidopsis thaliana]|eukprot:NP_565808.1 cystic fibrosis transmembrane conductance regulator [Arabidopsis thaliana]
MVGIFSRFSVVRGSHRRTQSAIDGREVLSPRSDLAPATNTTTTETHGIEVATEFKPVDHPMEPLDNDQPIQCPLPEPSILNDGRLWKERVSASSMRRRSDLAIVQDGMDEESDVSVTSIPSRTSQCNTNRPILPSLSAPEHDLLNLLEECKVSGSI